MTVERIEREGEYVRIETRVGDVRRSLQARLVVLADGGRGLLAGASDSVREKDYAQVAITSSVKTELPHQFCAYERFAAEGPIALLPVRERCALVWVNSPQRATELQALGDDAFLAALQAQFGERLGRFSELGARSIFPLRLRYAREVAQPGVVRVGNAAQAIHPVAAQGFNLGLRDVWSLVQTLTQVDIRSVDAAALASRYTRSRRVDRTLGIGVTDFLVQVFGSERPLLGPVRGLGLWLLENGAPLRRAFTRAMMFGTRL